MLLLFSYNIFPYIILMRCHFSHTVGVCVSVEIVETARYAMRANAAGPKMQRIIN